MAPAEPQTTVAEMLQAYGALVLVLVLMPARLPALLAQVAAAAAHAERSAVAQGRRCIR